MDKTVLISISGKVQGVFFRQSTKQKAIALGITGFVKNNADGSVEISATGDEQKIDELIKWCHQGPPNAKVEAVDVQEVSLITFENFTITK